MNGEALDDRHYPVGRCMADVDPPPQPDPWPHSAYGFDRHPLRNFDTWCFERDAELAAAEREQQASATDFAEFAARFRGCADLGLVEMALAAELILLAWRPRMSPSERNDARGTVIAGRLERERTKRAPFPSALAALAFALTNAATIGLGTGRSYRIAEDSVNATRARARLARTGRVLPRSANGERAGGYLPVEFMPAKQDRNGCIGGAVGEDAVFLDAVVDQCIGRANIEAIDLVILRKLRIERVKASVVADDLRRWAALDLSAEAVGKRAARALMALAEQFQARGLIPPMQGVRPRQVRAVEAANDAGAAEVVPDAWCVPALIGRMP